MGTWTGSQSQVCRVGRGADLKQKKRQYEEYVWNCVNELSTRKLQEVGCKQTGGIVKNRHGIITLHVQSIRVSGVSILLMALFSLLPLRVPGFALTLGILGVEYCRIMWCWMWTGGMRDNGKPVSTFNFQNKSVEGSSWIVSIPFCFVFFLEAILFHWRMSQKLSSEGSQDICQDICIETYWNFKMGEISTKRSLNLQPKKRDATQYEATWSLSPRRWISFHTLCKQNSSSNTFSPMGVNHYIWELRDSGPS